MHSQGQSVTNIVRISAVTQHKEPARWHGHPSERAGSAGSGLPSRVTPHRTRPGHPHPGLASQESGWELSLQKTAIFSCCLAPLRQSYPQRKGPPPRGALPKVALWHSGGWPLPSTAYGPELWSNSSHLAPFLLKKFAVNFSLYHRTIGSLRVEKTSKIIKSNRLPNTTMPAKPCPQLTYLDVF